MFNRKMIGRLCCCLWLAVSSLHSFAQEKPSWFIDGYHGGIWGHYPPGYTRFIVDQLNRYPSWNINLEIEPVTWDAVQQRDTAAYRQLQALMADTSINRRIEYVNPAYGQPYFYNISGESIIRQFQYGLQKLRQHFPGLTFTSYSSEEPCFTSALPQLLKSFAVRYASLKNPNTCWGGYTRAHGGELVNWIGPDGSSILTVPRYATEGLEKRSTWQTNAWGNSPAFLKAARDYGIQHPVGMCLQDAGWHNGPWLGIKPERQVTYTTWQQYFEQVADHTLATNWKVSQEDIQVSLVWGAQVLQRIAQQVRAAENKLIATEKLAAMATLRGYRWPQATFDTAWQNLLLAQHHDCWIVPYNRGQGSTWIEKVQQWTATTQRLCDSITAQAMQVLGSNATYDLEGKMVQEKQTLGNNTAYENAGTTVPALQVFNTSSAERNALVAISWSAKSDKALESVLDVGRNQLLPMQKSMTDSNGYVQLLFPTKVPATGYNIYAISNKKVRYSGAIIKKRAGKYVIETDHYQVTIDPAKGGAITSLIGKKLGNKQWIDAQSPYAFNQLTGNFFPAGGRRSTTDSAAAITILEGGPLRVKVQINTTLAGHPVQQVLTLVQGEPRIDGELLIKWQHNTGIGDDYNEKHPLKAEEYRKSFYNDREKLLLLFPMASGGQTIYRNAPFDVTKSNHENTFFTTWDSIKNNVILDWIDVMDQQKPYGMAIFTDHTSAYVHGDGLPPGLVVQYSGKGLWGMNYTVDGPTRMRYALLPHAGNWQEADIESVRGQWTAPLQTAMVLLPEQVVTRQPIVGMPVSPVLKPGQLLQLDKKGWEVSSIVAQGHDWLVRVYNAAATDTTLELTVQAYASAATEEELNGAVRTSLATFKAIDGAGNPYTKVSIHAPLFGICTIRFHNIIQQQAK